MQEEAIAKSPTEVIAELDLIGEQLIDLVAINNRLLVSTTRCLRVYRLEGSNMSLDNTLPAKSPIKAVLALSAGRIALVSEVGGKFLPECPMLMG